MTESTETVLVRLENKLDNHAGELAGHVLREEAWQKDTTRALQGIDSALRGDNKTTGINVRLDRIEQREAGRSRLAWIAIGTAAASFAGWIKTMFKG